MDETEIIEDEMVLQEKPEGKPKRKLSEKQLEALARGRQLGVQKLKQKGNITRQVNESNKQLQKMKIEEKISDIEEIKKINDLNYIRKSTEELMDRFNTISENINKVDSRFSGYLNEREERKKMKDNNLIQKTIKQELPKTMSDMMYKTKMEKEISNNPFYGRI